jgi:hypothetical protein
MLMIFAYGAGRSRVVWSRSSFRLGCSPHTTPWDKTAWCLHRWPALPRRQRDPSRSISKSWPPAILGIFQGTQPIAKDCVYAHRGPRPRACTHEAAIPMQRRGFLQASHGPLGFVRSGPGHSKASATAASTAAGGNAPAPRRLSRSTRQAAQ